MNPLLANPIFPQPQFLRLLKVDRNTVENWSRSGSLTPKKGARGRNPFFSPADLIKVRMMLALKEQLSTLPSHGAALADQLLAHCGDDLAKAMQRLVVRAVDPEALGEGRVAPFCEPAFSSTFGVDIGEQGPILSVDDHVDGAIVMIFPLQRWVHEAALAFVAMLMMLEGDGARLLYDFVHRSVGQKK